MTAKKTKYRTFANRTFLLWFENKNEISHSSTFIHLGQDMQKQINLGKMKQKQGN
jgi:hypothetical protein